SVSDACTPRCTTLWVLHRARRASARCARDSLRSRGPRRKRAPSCRRRPRTTAWRAGAEAHSSCRPGPADKTSQAGSSGRRHASEPARAYPYRRRVRTLLRREAAGARRTLATVLRRRAEERRVGEERGWGWGADGYKETTT